MSGQRKITIAEAVSLFLSDRKARGYAPGTLRFYRDKLTLFERWNAGQRIEHLDAITPHTVRAYFVSLIDRGNSTGAQNAAGRGIRAFLRWCAAEELVSGAPLRNVAIPKPPKQVLPAFSPADVQKLLAAAPDPRARAMIYVLLDTGARASELVALNGSDIDIATGQVTIRKGKGGKTRIVQISSTTRRHLLAYFRAAGWAEGDSPVWRNERTEGRLTVSGLRQILKTVGRDAGVKGCSPHQFRRTHAVWMLRRGVNLYVLARQMGHSGIEVLKRYLPLVEEDVAEAHHRAAIVDHYLHGREKNK